MRRTFAQCLHAEMRQDPDIYLIALDLGYGMFDQIQHDFPDRFINPGAAEQAGIGLAVGLAMSGKKPVVYTISPFLLRAYETIKLYLDHEKAAVLLVGSGRDDDYSHDGFSHHAFDLPAVFANFKNIGSHYPTSPADIEPLLRSLLASNQPNYLSLKR